MLPGDQRFPKEARLLKRAQFLAMGRLSHRVKTPNFLILWQSNGLRRSRMGLTVSARVAPAVGRNRIKRRLREAFRRAGPLRPAGVDLVVIARSGAARLSGEQVERQMHQALSRIEQCLSQSR